MSKAKNKVTNKAWERRGVKLRGFKEAVEIISGVDTKITCDRCGKPVFMDDGRVSPSHEFQWVKPFQWFLSCKNPSSYVSKP